MNQCITRRQKGKGIEITVVIKKDCYDVYIDITPEVDVSRKIVEKYYTLKLKLLNGKKTLEAATTPMCSSGGGYFGADRHLCGCHFEI